jgi:CheY-like chemotaxis protein
LAGAIRVNRERALKKILIVSWLQTFIDKEEDILRRAEYKIYTAMSGEEALKMHESQKMDLIITDLDTAGISGDKLCSMVKKEKKVKETFIILVCNDNKPDIEKCKKSGADFYLTKPINAAQLLKKIMQVFNVQRRESLRIPMEVSVVGSYFLQTFFCHAVDISSTGLLIETYRILNKGKTVSCLLNMPDARQIKVNGKIMRVMIKSNDIYRYGISFYDLNTDTISAIKTFVGKQTSIK